MTLGTRVDGGAQTMSSRIRITIHSIKEIVGNHSEAEIYAVLKESNMDPNETTQKLLNQDPFHEVKRKKDKKKENAGSATEWTKPQQNRQSLQRVSSSSTKHSENPIHWTKFQSSLYQDARGNARKASPGVTQEFRVVRDNRVNRNTERNSNQEFHYCAASGNEQPSNVPEKRNQERRLQTQGVSVLPDPNNGHTKYSNPVLYRPGPEKTDSIFSNSSLHPEAVFTKKSQTSVALASSNSGLDPSSSDPIHVPSPESRPAGRVGAIRCDAVGFRRPSSDCGADSTSQMSVSNDSVPISHVGKVVITANGSVGHAAGLTKNTHFRETPASVPNVSSSRSFSSNQYSNKLHQQPVGHKKAAQHNMEWKPKSSKRSDITNHDEMGGASVSLTSHPVSSIESNVETPCSSDKHSQASTCENELVIIPQHLRVPEGERANVKFGSFGTVDSTKNSNSAGSMEKSMKDFSESTTTLIPVESSECTLSEVQENNVDVCTVTPRLESPASAVASEHPGCEDIKSGAHNVVSYADVGLVENNSPSYSADAQQISSSPRLPKFSEAFDSQQNYDTSFFKSSVDNMDRLGLASQSEVFGSYARNGSLPTISTVQQQALTHQQQVGQLYPQVQLSHFTNYVPYRQFLSPLYVPPMAMPNYSSGTAYPHPSNGSSYLLMPGGSPHLAAAMKYTPSQYKPVPAGSTTGYGNCLDASLYAAGYSVTPGTIGSTAEIDDVGRIKYKDSSLYAPSPQVETSDVWIQTPRDSAPYYNIPAQGPPHSYLPTHMGHASFNAQAQPSPVQFPGLYHPPQPSPIGNHPMVHQQVSPGMGANVGVIAAPASQVGAYQQPQLGHLNWNNNF